MRALARIISVIPSVTSAAAARRAIAAFAVREVPWWSG
jgi:hypothetical protein